MEKKIWIVGICCTESDGVNLHTVTGTEEQVRQYLADAVQADRKNDADSYDCGTETAAEVEGGDGSLYAFGNYDNYHIDYSAVPLMDPIQL